MSQNVIGSYIRCAILIIIGLAAVYVWQNFVHEWIVLVGGLVLIVFGIVAGIRTR